MYSDAKPFLKWAGGKGKLLSQLDKHFPTNLGERDFTYIEPFVGGGAMLFHMLKKFPRIKKVVINDINPDLIHCYQLIKDNPQALIDRLKTIEKNYYCCDVNSRKDLYYAYRIQYNYTDISLDERAAVFIFLNHTCFNGLYRVNSSGKFNVPYGRYKKPVICNEKVIMADHKLLNSTEVVIRPPGDYKLVSRHLPQKGQIFMYLDPPYRPLLDECNFKSYSVSPFGDKQQEELKAFCDRMGRRGCMILLSNSDSKNPDGSSYFEELYEGYDFDMVYAPRFINAFPEKRVKLTEVVIKNY